MDRRTFILAQVIAPNLLPQAGHAVSTSTDAAAAGSSGPVPKGTLYASSFSELQAALDAAAAGSAKLIVDRSFNLGDRTITVPAGSDVECLPAVALIWTTQVTGLAFTGHTNLRSRWRFGTLIGAGNASYNPRGIAIWCTGTNKSPSAPEYVAGPDLDRIAIDGWGNYGISGYYLSNPSIRRCTITNIGYAGIGGMSWNDAEIYGNVIDGIGPGTSRNVYGIFVDRSNGTPIAEPVSARAKIIANTVKNATIWEGIDTHAGQDFVIVGNLVSGCAKGIVVTDSLVGAKSSLGPKRVIVAHNTIQCGNAGSAIILNGANDGRVRGTADAADGCVVEGNSILGGGIAGGGGTNGSIRLRTTSNCKVRGNVVAGAWAAGISVYYDNLNLEVSGNTLTDWRDTTDAYTSAISIAGDNNTGYIGGNTFSYAGSLTSTHTCVRSIDIAAGRSGLSLVFGPSSFQGIDASHLGANWGTTTGVNKSQLMQTSGGPIVLAGGTATVGFAPRFPSPPVVTVSPVSGLAVIRVSRIAADSFTAAGPDGDAFNYIATC